MKSYIIIVIVLLLGLLNVQGQSQEPSAPSEMPLSQIIDIALEHNPSVQIMRNRIRQSDNNHSPQPFLPTVGGTARYNQSHSDTKRVFQNNEQEFPNTSSENVNAGVSLSWTLFDGLGMFATYKRSALALSASEVETRRVVENLVVDLSHTYYRIVAQQHRVEAAMQLMDLSRERFRIITEQVNIGTASGMDLQQARLDLNADSSYLVRQKELLQNAYININQLINQPLRQSGFVGDTILLGAPLVEDDLVLMAQENNASLVSNDLGIAITREELKLAQARRFPTINFVTGYTYSRAESPAAVMQFSESNGYNYGLEASLNIFNGFEVNRAIKNSRIEIENRHLTYDETRLMVMGELHSLYNTYLNNLMMVDFEKQNVEVARANLNLALERYELWVLSGLGF
ncbi:MAG: TolC family protein, partial [Bacteroidales bacterium]|nr:TolC family protein [Bacteroidales bacterium]